jgi:hypothetical protein
VLKVFCKWRSVENWRLQPNQFCQWSETERTQAYTWKCKCDEVLYMTKSDRQMHCQQLNVLKRIGCFLSKLNKLTIFHTFILSNFNFCPLAWHFCNKSNTSKLEKNPGEGFTIYIRGLWEHIWWVIRKS